VRLEGVHHITCISADAQRNVDFYVSVLGLRLVKKTINFDVPDAYHLYYGDDVGTPGSILTFFEYPNRPPGRAGAGMIHRINWRIRNETALSFWSERLSSNGVGSQRDHAGLKFTDPEGLGLGFVIDDGLDPALAVVTSSDIPSESQLLGFEGVSAFSRDATATEELLVKTLGFTSEGGNAYLIEGERHNRYGIDPAPGTGTEGAGTVHHIAWACSDEKTQLEWREALIRAGLDVTEVIDRKYFRSIYFREPSGVLFEIATSGPGFSVDESVEELGQTLSLPEWHEHRREDLERRLTPVIDPRRKQD
jgi:glyoxalase family protein